MADDSLTTAIQSNATSPQSMSGDGISVTNNAISEQIAAKKFLDANQAIDDIMNGNGYLPSIVTRPPGAGGTYLEDC